MLSEVFDKLPEREVLDLDNIGRDENLNDEDGENSTRDGADKDNIHIKSEKKDPGREGSKWSGKEIKRVLLAAVDDDSTVVYYIVHDGLVKPRQN